MSPEQVRGDTVDARTDIFSFGCVFYEMLTGKRAFSRETVADTLSAILKEDPPIQEIPLQVQEVVKHCLEKNPEQRFHSAHDLAFAQKAILNASGFTRTAESRLSSPRLILITAVVLAGIGLLTGLLLWQKSSHSVSTSKRIRSIAVLPLANLSGDSQQEYFSDGMTDELISDLAKIKALRVISRTSVMQYKATRKPLPQIARELNVDAVVEGSVLRSGNRVRITAQLIDAPTDTHLWAESYERDLRDILALQSEVAKAIASEIRIQMTPGELRRLSSSRPVNPEAHEAYLKGRYQINKYNKEGFENGIAYLEQSIAKDPNYAPPYAALATCLAWRALEGLDSPATFFSRAKTAALKALQLDDELVEAHVALADVLLLFDWDWSGCERESKRAIELNPGSPLGHEEYSFFLILIGRFQEGIVEAKRAQQLDPVTTGTTTWVGKSYFHARRYDEAIAEYKKAYELGQENVFAPVALAYLRKGMLKEALIEFEEIRKFTTPGESISLDCWLSAIYVQIGRRDEALKLLQTWQRESEKRYVDPSSIAYMYACLGEKDQSFKWLEKSYAERSPGMVFLKVDFCFENLQQDPRYAELIARIRFPD